jgi:hypothetical protein
MAGETSGVVFISHRDTFPELRGSAGSRLWRLGFVATLVEKSDASWVLSAAGHAAGQSPRQLVLANLKPGRPVVEALAVAALGLFGLPKEISDRAAYENVLRERDGVRYVGSNYLGGHTEATDEILTDETVMQPSDELVRLCIRAASEIMRLGVAALPDSVLVQEQSVPWLRADGFDVDEFAYRPLT